MKIKATILAIIVGLLIIQPLFAKFGLSEAYGSCEKQEPVKQCPAVKKQCAAKKPCTKEKPAEKKDCEGNKCNPLLGCSAGNFFVHHYYTIPLLVFSVPKQKTVVMNDNRLSKQQNECWHPPEII